MITSRLFVGRAAGSLVVKIRMVSQEERMHDRLFDFKLRSTDNSTDLGFVKRLDASSSSLVDVAVSAAGRVGAFDHLLAVERTISRQKRKQGAFMHRLIPHQ